MLLVAGTFCSTALATAPPPSPLPSLHCFNLHFVLSDGTCTWMQVMLHFCFLNFTSKLGQQQYLPSHFVSKGMDTSRGVAGVTQSMQHRDKGAERPWHLHVATEPVSIPSPGTCPGVPGLEISSGWVCQMGSCSEGTVRLPAQPSSPALTYSLGQHFKYFLSLTLPRLSPGLLLPWPAPCHPPTHPDSFSKTSIQPLPIPWLPMPQSRAPAAAPALMWGSRSISIADIVRRSVRDEKNPRKNNKMFYINFKWTARQDFQTAGPIHQKYSQVRGRTHTLGIPKLESWNKNKIYLIIVAGKPQKAVTQAISLFLTNGFTRKYTWTINS